MSNVVEIRHYASYSGVKQSDMEAIEEAIELYNSELLEGEDEMSAEEYIGLWRRRELSRGGRNDDSKRNRIG